MTTATLTRLNGVEDILERSEDEIVLEGDAAETFMNGMCGEHPAIHRLVGRRPGTAHDHPTLYWALGREWCLA